MTISGPRKLCPPEQRETESCDVKREWDFTQPTSNSGWSSFAFATVYTKTCIYSVLLI